MFAPASSSSVCQLRRSSSSSSSSAAGDVERARRAAEDEESVARHRLAGRDDLPRRDAAVAGEQRHERLVLGGLAPAEPKRRPAVLVPERPPELRDQLRVVRVAPVHLDQQRRARSSRGRAPRRRRRAGRSADGEVAPRRRRARAAAAATAASPGRPAEVPKASRTPAAAATATRKPAAHPLGVAGPARSAPVMPSATTQRPVVCSGSHELGRDR